MPPVEFIFFLPLLFVFRFKDSLEAKMVTTVAIHTDHRISTYRLPALTELSAQLGQASQTGRPDGDAAAAPEHRQSKADPSKGSSTFEGGEVFLGLFHPSEIRLSYHLGVFSRRGGAASLGVPSSGGEAGRSAG